MSILFSCCSPDKDRRLTSRSIWIWQCIQKQFTQTLSWDHICNYIKHLWFIMNPSVWIRHTSEWTNKVMAVRKRHVQLWLLTARVLLCWTNTSAVEADSAARIDASIAADDNHGTSFFNMRTLPHIMIQYIISKGCDYSAAWVLFCISTQPHLGKNYSSIWKKMHL